MARLLLAVYAVVHLSLTNASIIPIVIGRGRCPDPGSMLDFNKIDYLGTWYEYEKFPNVFEAGQDCVQAEYGSNDDDSISVRNSGILRLPFGYKRRVSVDGRAIVPDPSKPGELVVSFFGRTPGNDPNYIVVDTDYETYSVVFSCRESRFLNLNVQTAWILTRIPGQPPANLMALRSNLQAAGIDVRKLEITSQTDCQV